MKRTLDPLFLPRSPLVFTLGQVQFDPVLAIASYIPDIQETLRKSGFPKLRERLTAHRIVQVENSQLRSEAKKQWEFYNIENHTSILVDQDAVMVQTTHYTTFEEFHDVIELALETVADRLEVSQVIRCGLRYIDAVEQPEDGDIADFVEPTLLGLPDLPGFGRRNSQSITELDGEGGTLIRVRASLVRSGVVLPPDLIPCDLAFKRPPRRESPFVLLDFDHFSRQSFDYDREATLEHLAMLHDGLDHAFRSSVTPTALEEWKKP